MAKQDPNTGMVDPWASFTGQLTAYLRSTVDATEADVLILELPGCSCGGMPRYVQFSAQSVPNAGRWVRAEIVGDHFIAAHDQLSDAVRRVLRTTGWQGNTDAERNWFQVQPMTQIERLLSGITYVLREGFALPDPHLLTYKAWGPAAGRTSVLGLAPSGGVPVEETAEARSNEEPPELDPISMMTIPALHPDDHAMLVYYVGEILTELRETPTTAVDGHFFFEHGGIPLLISVDPDLPSISFGTQIGEPIARPQVAYEVLNGVNNHSKWSRWGLTTEGVWQSAHLLASPLVPEHVATMLTIFIADAKHARQHLLPLLTGGQS